MKKKVEVEVNYIKKTTSMIIAVIALVIGFALGIGYTSFDKENPSKREYTTTQQNNQPDNGPDHSNDKKNALIENLKKTVQANPQDAKSWMLLGNNYFDTGRPLLAISAYKKYLELDPNNPNVWTDMGVMYRRSNNPSEAISSFNNAIKVDPKHETSRFNKGIVLMHDLNDMEGAIKTWEDLLKTNPSAKTPSGQPLANLIKQYKNTGK